LQRDQCERRVPEPNDDPSKIQYRREMKGPVASLNGIAKATKCARNRLRKNSEIDEIAVRVIADRSERTEEHRIEQREKPWEAIAH
jgi:hypothetical protein